MDAQPSRLAQAGKWYLQAVDAVPPDGWTKATRCEGWTPAHVVAHVATGDQLFRARIFDATGKDRTGLDLAGRVLTLPEPRFSEVRFGMEIASSAIL